MNTSNFHKKVHIAEFVGATMICFMMVHYQYLQICFFQTFCPLPTWWDKWIHWWCRKIFKKDSVIPKRKNGSKRVGSCLWTQRLQVWFRLKIMEFFQEGKFKTVTFRFEVIELSRTERMIMRKVTDRENLSLIWAQNHDRDLVFLTLTIHVFSEEKIWFDQDLNPRHPAWKADALITRSLVLFNFIFLEYNTCLRSQRLQVWSRLKIMNFLSEENKKWSSFSDLKIGTDRIFRQHSKDKK